MSLSECLYFKKDEVSSKSQEYVRKLVDGYRQNGVEDLEIAKEFELIDHETLDEEDNA